MIAAHSQRGSLADAGVVLCAVGADYAQMARGVQRSLALHAPELPVDLFTDVDVGPDGFARVVRLETPWRRSKIDAMIASRFERTLYLDADIFATNPVREMLDLLERFDIAAAHDGERNTAHACALWRKPIPAAFPQFNTGVIAYRRSPETIAVLCDWRDAIRAENIQRDQPVFRELVWDSDLRIATMPPEFNFVSPENLLFYRNSDPAPRILHYYRRRGARVSAHRPPELADVLSPALRSLLTCASRADLALSKGADQPPVRLRSGRKRLLQLKAFAELTRERLFRRRRAGQGSRSEFT